MAALDITTSLRRAGLVHGPEPVIEPLPGGVSSDIIHVKDGDQQFVVKRALAKLKVRDDWFADVSRNQVEENYLRRVAKIAPGHVPRVLHSQPDEGWFAMEFLGGGLRELEERVARKSSRPVPCHQRR